MEYYIGHPSPRHFYVAVRETPNGNWKTVFKHAHIMQEVDAFVNNFCKGYTQVSDPYERKATNETQRSKT